MVEVGLKLQVEEERLNGGMGIMLSRGLVVVGEALPGAEGAPPPVRMWLSLILGRDNGDLTTEPGVMLGSSSILFSGLPCWYKSTKYKKIIPKIYDSVPLFLSFFLFIFF